MKMVKTYFLGAALVLAWCVPVVAGPPCACDLNHDTRCDMRDWLVFGQRWGATNCNTVPCACDLNTDGRCDMRDWLLFGQGWGRTDCDTYAVSGHVWYSQGGGGMEGVTVTISTSPVRTAVTGTDGSYSFPGVAGGAYTLTPELEGSVVKFYPPGASVTVSGHDVSQDFWESTGVVVSGTISYGGAQSGRVFIQLLDAGSGSEVYGTSIASPGAYTIRGVESGTYVLRARMDTLGYGTWNAVQPAGTQSPVVVAGTDLPGRNVTLADVVPPEPGMPTGVRVTPADQAALIMWNGTYNGERAETATAYRIYWGTDPDTDDRPPITVPACGQNVYIQGLANGTYYYRVAALVGNDEGAASDVVGPVTVAAGVGACTVSGTAAIPVTPTGPLSVILMNSDTYTPYFTRIASPSTSQAYSISGVPSGTYGLYAIVDMNADGLIDAGDLTLGMARWSQTVVVEGSGAVRNIALSGSNASVQVTTLHRTDGVNEGYELEINVAPNLKRPVRTAVTAGPNVAIPVDLGCTKDNQPGRSELSVSLGSTRPNAGDAYTFELAYSDGTTQTITGTVSAVLDSFVQGLAVDTAAPYVEGPGRTLQPGLLQGHLYPVAGGGDTRPGCRAGRM